MHRPWQIAVVFALCLAVVLAALAWTSRQVLRLDAAEADARRQAQVEENVRLALWRMESALGPLVAQEAARPYFEYAAFYPAERAYTRLFNEVGKGDIVLPSPLLVQLSPYVLLNFQVDPEGGVTSPQVPPDSQRKLAEGSYTTREAVDAAAARLAQLQPSLEAAALAAVLPPPQQAPSLALNVNRLQPQAQEEGGQQAAAQQTARNVKEWQARAQNWDNVSAGNLQQMGANRAFVVGDVREGIMAARWLGDRLVLARRVSVNGRQYVQGAWLDWPALRGGLLASVRDLVPQADLAPVRESTGPQGRRPARSSLPDRYGSSEEPAGDGSRLLAALPLRLVPGEVLMQSDGGWSPLRIILAVAWAAVLVAGAAVAALLWGTVALSERRAAFVSAVTHELRTPLTTFRMYSEMLAADMVPDEAKRRRYLETLRVEADRLVHLVENVLAYARLERGRAQGRAEVIAMDELVHRVSDRLAERASQAGMELVVEPRSISAAARTAARPAESDGATSAPPPAAVLVRADPSAVEQILFNLVDNACKYAAMASDRRIHLAAGTAGGRAVLRVSDHGPGISPADARRLFRPFSKSARDAANSAPGVGLGLALSRRLAREMGGDLVLVPADGGGGACLALSLPLA